MESTNPIESKQRLVQLRDLFERAVASDSAEQQQIVAATRSENPTLARRLEAMLRIDRGTESVIGGTQIRNTAEDQIAGRMIAGYEILEEIGRGGMGVVYRARQLHPERIVALKMIRVGRWASKTEVQRFEVEISAVAKLEHPNIVSIFEIGEQDGEHFFTMQYIDGGRFDEYLASEQFDRHGGVKLFLQICEAVAYCHSEGVVHRDLKPSNVLLDRLTPKVTDFGLAKRVNLESSITNTGDLMGTPGYMAPEQASNNLDAVVDARADVYSLGAILYKLLTGSVPIEIENGDLLSIIERIHTSDITLPRSHDRSIPIDLEAICMKCLERRPEDRYNDAQELADDVQRFLDQEPVTAVPITKVRRIYNWSRRQPGLAITLVGVSAFYCYHLICVYLLKLYDLTIPANATFHRNSTTVAFLWLVGATFFQWQLMNATRPARWPILGWVTMEVVLFTAFLALSEATATSPLCCIYLLLVAISVLRFDPRIVSYVTATCLASFLFLTWRSTRVSLELEVTDVVPMVLCIVCIGLIQFFALRRSRTVVQHLANRD